MKGKTEAELMLDEMAGHEAPPKKIDPNSLDLVWENIEPCDDKRLRQATQQVKKFGKFSNFNEALGFKFEIGINERGSLTFYIENGIKKAPNMIVTTPFTLAEWNDATTGKRQ